MADKPAEHSPLPWRAEFSEHGGYDCMTDAWRIIGADDHFVADVDLGSYGQSTRSRQIADAHRAKAKASVDLIVRAANSHQMLIDALKSCQSLIVRLHAGVHTEDEYRSAYESAAAALRLAEGQGE